MIQLMLVPPPVYSVSLQCSHEFLVFYVFLACTIGSIMFHTGIHDLFEVKVALKDIVDWQPLGLALGLLHSTLKKIETENHEKIDKCITEMLAAWLQQQDDVPMRGVPSWLVLKTALGKIGENELAIKMNT